MIAEDEDGFEALVVQHAEARGGEPDKVKESFARLDIPHGTIEQASESFARLADEGVTRVYLQGAFSDLDGVATTVAAARAAAA